MAKIENTLECIDTLMGKMKANGITKLKYSSDDFELELKTEKEQPIFAQQSFLAPAQAPQPAPMAQNSAAVASGNVVKSPIVGT
ncbi:MAG: acetyl-CoA carboxylase, biotin carboxyl carrier protein, partial [Oscillospiraceae bacterium]